MDLARRLYFNARFTAPWAYQSQPAVQVAPLLEPGADRLVIFHMIVESECWVQLEGAAPVRLGAGEVVLFPQGHGHLMSSQPGLPPVRSRRLGGMLLAGLPPNAKVDVRASRADSWLEASVRYALAEARSPRPGGDGLLPAAPQLPPESGG